MIFFSNLLKNAQPKDGTDIGPLMRKLFQVLNTPSSKRQRKLDEDLARFPHVNGDLFDASNGNIPDFDAKMRKILIDASYFKLDKNIPPAIFGALFQAIMDPEERRAPRHTLYKQRKISLKVIEPLFLDNLARRISKN